MTCHTGMFVAGIHFEGCTWSEAHYSLTDGFWPTPE